MCSDLVLSVRDLCIQIGDSRSSTGSQLREPFARHHGLSRKAADRAALDVVTQAQELRALRSHTGISNTALLLIT